MGEEEKITRRKSSVEYMYVLRLERYVFDKEGGAVCLGAMVSSVSFPQELLSSFRLGGGEFVKMKADELCEDFYLKTGDPAFAPPGKKVR